MPGRRTSDQTVPNAALSSAAATDPRRQLIAVGQNFPLDDLGAEVTYDQNSAGIEVSPEPGIGSAQGWALWLVRQSGRF